MNPFLKALALCAAITFLAGCDPVNPDNPDNPDNPGGPDNPTGDYFKLVSIYDSSKEAETFYIAGYQMGSYSLVVNTSLASDKYSATSSADWCKPVFDGGLLRLNYEQYGEKNDMLNPRVCVVEVKAGSFYDGTITIVQQSGSKKLGTITYKNSFELPADGSPIDIIIQTTLWDWKIENANDWIKAEHIDRETLRVSAVPRDYDAAKRSGKIYLYSVTYKQFDSDMEYDSYKLFFNDADPVVAGDDYGYGDHTDWD